MDRYKTDRAEIIATFVRICRNADPVEVLQAIFLRWPDITLDELWRGIDLTASRVGGPARHPELAKALALFCFEPVDLHHQVVEHHSFVADRHTVKHNAEPAAQCESLVDPYASPALLDVVPSVPAETEHPSQLRLLIGDRPTHQTKATRHLGDGVWISALHGLRLARRLMALAQAGIQFLSNFFFASCAIFDRLFGPLSMRQGL